MNWENFVKRYVWDDERTPYFVGVGKLTRQQADHEIYIYAIFLGVLFGVLTIVALAGGLPQGRSQAVALYGFTMVCSTILLGATKHVWTALYCSAAPVAVLFHLFTSGFPPRLGTIDRLALILFALVWLRYSMRIVGLAKAYPDLPAGTAPRRNRRRTPLPPLDH